MTLFTDSHCHLDRLDLSATDGDFSRFYQESLQPGLDQMLCVSIDLESYPAMMEMVQDFDRIHTSVGVHPNDFDRHDPQVSELVDLYRQYPSNVAIGETGLDYFRSSGDMQWQQQRFRNHIRAACELGRPLIIHTRDAREDTIRILREEKADQVGGVMHCFTETWEMAEQAMEMGFYISFSGIVTFNSAEDLRETARKMPLERILIETDSPYLAPVPHRGKPNYPYYVEKVAQKIADLREMNIDQVAELTTQNFNNLFIN